MASESRTVWARLIGVPEYVGSLFVVGAIDFLVPPAVKWFARSCLVLVCLSAKLRREMFDFFEPAVAGKLTAPAGVVDVFVCCAVAA